MSEPAFDPPDEDLRSGETHDPKAKGLRPKDAATLILARRDGPRPRVLMGRRAGGHVFMPDKWVFPGGRIDRADFRAPVAAELRPEVAARLSADTPERRARALALAAVRETFEETGLMLGRDAEPLSVRGAWGPFLARGARPDLSGLSFVARAVTPPYRPRRFDARFFLADAQALRSLEPEAGCGEILETAWFDLDEALGLDLPLITAFVLKRVETMLADPDAPAPFLRFVRGKREVRWI